MALIGDPPGSLDLYQMSRLEVGAWVTLRIMILLRTRSFSCMSSKIMGDTWWMTLSWHCIRILNWGHYRTKLISGTSSKIVGDTWQVSLSWHCTCILNEVIVDSQAMDTWTWSICRLNQAHEYKVHKFELNTKNNLEHLTLWLKYQNLTEAVLIQYPASWIYKGLR